MMLNELGVKYSTDKSSLRHHYLDLYEILFARFTRHLYIELLEIGVQFGNSIRMWREYFPYAHVTGIDTIDNHAQGANEMFYGDAYTQEMVRVRLGNKKFHIIIEDGSHEPEHQRFTVLNYPDLLTPDGILVIEDISMEETARMLSDNCKGFHHAIIDLRSVAPGVPDNILFLCWRK